MYVYVYVCIYIYVTIIIYIYMERERERASEYRVLVATFRLRELLLAREVQGRLARQRRASGRVIS